MWTTERQSEFRNLEASPEIEGRMHADLLALQGLADQLPLLVDGRTVVEKGYAVDAICNGRLTRTHYDTDLILATPHAADRENLYGVIGEVLGRATGFEWVPTQQERRSWVKFHEAGKRQWDDGTTGTERDEELAHQMDLHVVFAQNPFAEDESIELRPRPGVVYQKPVTRASLWDTTGQRFDLTVPTIGDQLATKLRLIRSFDTFYGKGQRPSDFYDFGLLFSNPDFDPGTFLELLRGYYESQGQSIDEADASIKEGLQVVSAVVPDKLTDLLATQPSI